jgi:hypothetical protein
MQQGPGDNTGFTDCAVRQEHEPKHSRSARTCDYPQRVAVGLARAGQGHRFRMGAKLCALPSPGRPPPGAQPAPLPERAPLICRAGQPAQTGTIRYPAARMPPMMAGRAATVCERLPPPSCRITMAPGCRAASTRRVITAAPGLR